MYHKMSKEETQELLERSKKDIGKHLFAMAKEDGATRLFIKSCSTIRDALRKHGWWETFTISKKPCEVGTYICKILDFRLDSHGYLNCVVEPVIQMTDDLSDGWFDLFRDDSNRNGLAVLFNSGLFAERYLVEPSPDHFNVKALFAKYGEGVDKPQELYAAVTRQVLEGKTTITEVTKTLHTPTEYEYAGIDLKNEAEGLSPKHHLLVKRALALKGDRYVIPMRDLVNLVEDKALEYERLVNKGVLEGGLTAPLDQGEAAMAYWDNVHKEQKAAKKAAKKAGKKAAATA